MGQVVYILGRSGTGKSYSMRNFPADKLAVLNVQGKILPFRGAAQIEATVTDQSDKIVKGLELYAKNYKSIVIDDYQYIMSNEFMRRSTERGYDKFTEIARHAWDIVESVRSLPADVIVYVMCHLDRDDDGNEKIKTIGKLLDEKICLEGMSTIVLKTNVSDGVYTFLTQNNGKDTVKSPEGMFPSYAIDNDLYYVDQKIRNYYGFSGSLTDDEIAEIDEAAKNVDVIKEPEKKRRRNAKEKELAEAPAEEKKEEAGEPKRRGRRIKDIEDTEKGVGDSQSEPGTDEMGGRIYNAGRTRKTREEVTAANGEAIVNAGLSEAGEDEGVPFEEVTEPTLEKPARRKRKDRSNEQEPAQESEAPETAVSEQPAEAVEQSVESTDAPTPRRRRRRA